MNKLRSVFEFSTRESAFVELHIDYIAVTYSIFPKHGSEFDFINGKPDNTEWADQLESINKAIVFAKKELCI